MRSALSGKDQVLCLRADIDCSASFDMVIFALSSSRLASLFLLQENCSIHTLSKIEASAKLSFIIKNGVCSHFDQLLWHCTLALGWLKFENAALRTGSDAWLRKELLTDLLIDIHSTYVWLWMNIILTRSLGALLAPTSSWRPFGPC